MLLVFNKIWFSLWQSIVTTGLCLAAGGGLAIFLHYKKVEPTKWFFSLIMLPVFLPSVIVATGFIAVWGNAGYVNKILSSLGLNQIKFLYSALAIIAAHCFYNIPLAYLAVNSRLVSAHNYLEEALKIQGANFWQVFQFITWPRIKNACIGSSILIFLYNFLSFAVPLILGGVKYQTLEVYIYSLATQRLEFSTALFLAIMQFSFLAILIIFFAKQINKLSEKKIKVAVYKKSSFVALFLQGLIGLFIGAPLVAIVIKGFSAFDLTKIIELGFIDSYIRSLVLAMSAIILNLIIVSGLLKYRVSKYVILGLAVSPVMLGLILFLILGKSLIVMTIAYAILTIPISYYFVFNLYSSRPVYFDDTLQILGANKLQEAWQNIKYLKPAIVQNVLLVYIFVVGDIAISGLLSPYNKPTVMKLAYSLLGNYRFGAASSIMALVLCSIFLFIIIINNFKKYDIKSK